MDKFPEIRILEEHPDWVICVKPAGAAVGMQDPYHFSKQFKHIVGISPSAFMKQASVPSATIRGVTAKTKKK